MLLKRYAVGLEQRLELGARLCSAGGRHRPLFMWYSEIAPTPPPSTNPTDPTTTAIAAVAAAGIAPHCRRRGPRRVRRGRVGARSSRGRSRARWPRWRTPRESRAWWRGNGSRGGRGRRALCCWRGVRLSMRRETACRGACRRWAGASATPPIGATAAPDARSSSSSAMTVVRRQML